MRRDIIIALIATFAYAVAASAQPTQPNIPIILGEDASAYDARSIPAGSPG